MLKAGYVGFCGLGCEMRGRALDASYGRVRMPVDRWVYSVVSRQSECIQMGINHNDAEEEKLFRECLEL